MEENKSDSAIKNDVLHPENHSKLTPEEIAKAVAHHNRHHKADHKENAPKKAEPMKQQVREKGK
jgi:hypothetical protein